MIIELYYRLPCTGDLVTITYYLSICHSPSLPISYYLLPHYLLPITCYLITCFPLPYYQSPYYPLPYYLMAYYLMTYYLQSFTHHLSPDTPEVHE